MWNLKYDTNLSMKQKQTHRHGEQTCDWQGGAGHRRVRWEFGVSRCKLYVEWLKQQGPTV